MPEVQMSQAEQQLPQQQRDPSLDSGWAWVVAVAVCIVNVISLGSIRCLGILVSNASVEFSVNKRDSSIVFSVTYITFMLSSILFIGLTRVVSCRVLVFSGGLLMCCGLSLGRFLPSPGALASGTAVLLGLGLSASQNPAILLLNQYFDRFRSRANGVAFAGGPIGSLLMPPLITHLMLAYTFKGAMLLWGGLTLHVCVAACLLRPKPPPPPPPQQQPQPPPSRPLSERKSLTSLGPAYGASLDGISTVPYAEDGTETVAGDDDDDVDRAESAAATPEAEAEEETVAGATDAAAEAPLTGASGKRSFRATLQGACGAEARLFRRPVFYALGLTITLGLCGLSLSFYIVPLHGNEIGLSSTTVSLFLLLQGIPDMGSRLLGGFLTDKKLLSHLRLVWICLLAQSAAWFILLATPNYAGLLAFAAACGLLGGVVMSTAHPLAIGQLGLANYRAALATYSVVHGCWMLCLPILLGSIYDKTNSWRLAIAFVGLLLAVAGIAGLLLDISQSFKELTHRVVGRMWRRR